MDPELDTIPDGDLDSLIENTQYEGFPQSTEEPQVAQGTDESPQGVQDEPSSGAGINATAQETLPPGTDSGAANLSGNPLTTESQGSAVPQFQAPAPEDPGALALRQQNELLLRQVNLANQQAQQLRVQEENRAFENSIADLPDEEKVLARTRRENAMLQYQNRYLVQQRNREDQQKAQQAQMAQESNAKQTLVAIIAEENGIQSEIGLRTLIRAQSYEELLGLAKEVAQYENGQREYESWKASQAQQAPLVQSTGQNRPVDTPGLEGSSGAGITPPANGSGDLMALINQTAYQVV
jgi:hypothetical protein